MSKKCTICQIEKLALDYHKDSSRADGLSVRCKACVKDHAKIYYVKNRELMLSKSNDWSVKNKERSSI